MLSKKAVDQGTLNGFKKCLEKFENKRGLFTNNSLVLGPYETSLRLSRMHQLNDTGR